MFTSLPREALREMGRSFVAFSMQESFGETIAGRRAAARIPAQ
jgi:hypothetical protein